jgi:hypothetical protein
MSVREKLCLASKSLTPTIARNYLVHECGHLTEKHSIWKTLLTIMMSLAISESIFFFYHYWVILSISGTMAFLIPLCFFVPRLNQFFEYRADRYIAGYGDPTAQIAYWWQRNETYSVWATYPADRQRALALAHITGLALPPDDALQ